MTNLSPRPAKLAHLGLPSGHRPLSRQHRAQIETLPIGVAVA
jgi:hypothetical protein